MSPASSEPDATRPSNPGSVLNLFGIRCLDLLGAGLGLLLLSPLMLVLAAIVRLTSDGPALFRPARVGRDGRPFRLYKFRSMIVGAPKVGPAITPAEDPRITSVGRWMRRLKLDELPQLLNVLKGDMSLVGPRPEDPQYVALYSPDQLTVLQTKPGMTSPASLRYRDESSQLTGEDWYAHYVSKVMPAKLAIDGAYIGSRTPWTDIVIILKTFWYLTGSRREQG
ncbi:MAG: sugar transferase [Actinobacteria bacterium]|nr:sugar transferase [Actinomycetota bacterium]